MREQDVEFLNWLEEHEDWYSRWSTFWGVVLALCQTLTLLSAIVSIVVAAAVSPEYFTSVGRWLIIAASALTAISSETLTRLRVREREALREEGRLEAAAIVAFARQRFEENADDPSRISKIKDAIRRRVEIVERNQHRRAVTIETPKPEGEDPKRPREDKPKGDGEDK